MIRDEFEHHGEVTVLRDIARMIKYSTPSERFEIIPLTPDHMPPEPLFKEKVIMKNKEPLIIVINQRSLLAPNAAVFLGIGDRAARYKTQIEHLLLPLIRGASGVLSGYRKLPQHLSVTLPCDSSSSQKNIPPVLAVQTLTVLCRLADAVKRAEFYNVALNYNLPKSRKGLICVESVLVDVVKKYMDTLLPIHDAFFPEAQPPVEPVVDFEPLEVKETQA